MFKKQRIGSLQLFPFMLFSLFLLLAFVLPYFQPSLAVTMRPDNGKRANTATIITPTKSGTTSTIPDTTTHSITPTAPSGLPQAALTPTPFQPASITAVPTLHPTAAAAPTAVATTTTSQTKVPCYHQGHPISPSTLTPNVYLYPPSTPWFTTTSSCVDINVNFSQLTAPIQMQVCFIRTQACNSWKTISSTGTWYQIATTVLDGTMYRFGIKNTQTATIQGVISD